MASYYRISAFLLIIPLIAGCGGRDFTNPDAGSSGDGVAEISEYMGEPLTATWRMHLTSIGGVPEIDIDSWRLRVEGLVDTPREFTYDELLAREKVSRVVWLHCVDGWSAKILWEGFSLRDLFDEVGIQNQASYAMFYAADGFHNYLTVSFIRVNDIIAATHANGRPLRTDRGFPLHIISMSKYGYKWCKWVTRIVLSDSPEDGGTYENTGYPRDGNVGDSYYDPDESLLTP